MNCGLGPGSRDQLFRATGLVVGLVFIVAAISKFVDPVPFIKFGVVYLGVEVGWALVGVVAAVEMMVGLACLIRQWRTVGLALAGLCLSVFVVVLVIAAGQGAKTCGCLGIGGIRIVHQLWIDGALLLAIGFSLGVSRFCDGPESRSDLAPVGT